MGMVLSSPTFVAAALIAAIVLPLVVLYVSVKYSRIVGRIFEEMPVFKPVRVPPEPGGEEVQFGTEDGLTLAGTYYRTQTESRAGVVVFCHELLGDRHSVHHYADPLCEVGFDVFTFDFRNHGDSDAEAGVEPIQWLSDRDRLDLRAALAYLRSRPDHDPAGVGLFGVSRGGNAALFVASEDPTVWAVATDGAFGTQGTMMAYIERWAEIYIGDRWRAMLPQWAFRYVAWTGIIRTQRRLNRRFLEVAKRVARLAPRPWLSIHGARDAYISPAIARDLFDRGGEPKTFWLVPKAKHNRCREVEPEEYRRRVSEFFLNAAPRRPVEPVLTESESASSAEHTIATLVGSRHTAEHRLKIAGSR